MAFFAICNPRHCEQIFNLRGNLFLRTINNFPLHFQVVPFLILFKRLKTLSFT